VTLQGFSPKDAPTGCSKYNKYKTSSGLCASSEPVWSSIFREPDMSPRGKNLKKGRTLGIVRPEIGLAKSGGS
jgi:hypothetical protein